MTVMDHLQRNQFTGVREHRVNDAGKDQATAAVGASCHVWVSAASMTGDRMGSYSRIGKTEIHPFIMDVAQAPVDRFVVQKFKRYSICGLRRVRFCPAFGRPTVIFVERPGHFEQLRAKAIGHRMRNGLRTPPGLNLAAWTARKSTGSNSQL